MQTTQRGGFLVGGSQGSNPDPTHHWRRRTIGVIEVVEQGKAVDQHEVLVAPQNKQVMR